jgi:DNA polymerase-1
MRLLHAECPYIRQNALIEASEIEPDRIWDVGVAAYLLDSALATSFLSLLPLVPTTEHGAGASDESPLARAPPWGRVCSFPCSAKRSQMMDRGSLRRLEMPLLPVLLQMERTGLYADASILAEQSARLATEIDHMVEHIHEEAQEDFNIDSPMQLSHVLFDTLGLPTVGLKKTKRGYYSTNAKVLEDLAQTYPLWPMSLNIVSGQRSSRPILMRCQRLFVGMGAFIPPLIKQLLRPAAFRAQILTCKIFPPVRNWVIGFAVPLRFLRSRCFLPVTIPRLSFAYWHNLSGDEHLIEAFCEGEDFHAETAARVFGVPISEVTPALRSRAKAVNFGIVYGQQAYGLATSLKISRAEAQEMIDRYYTAYPAVRTFLDRQVALAHKQGWVATMYGRKRHIAEISQRNRQLVAFGERTAMNHPMQGSAADIIKKAMIQVQARLAQEHLAARLVHQIHAELAFEGPKHEIEVLSALVKETMEGVVKLRVPLVAEVSYGSTWAEAK